MCSKLFLILKYQKRLEKKVFFSTDFVVGAHFCPIRCSIHINEWIGLGCRLRVRMRLVWRSFAVHWREEGTAAAGKSPGNLKWRIKKCCEILKTGFPLLIWTLMRLFLCKSIRTVKMLQLHHRLKYYAKLKANGKPGIKVRHVGLHKLRRTGVLLISLLSPDRWSMTTGKAPVQSPEETHWQVTTTSRHVGLIETKCFHLLKKLLSSFGSQRKKLRKDLEVFSFPGRSRWIGRR